MSCQWFPNGHFQYFLHKIPQLNFLIQEHAKQLNLIAAIKPFVWKIGWKPETKKIIHEFWQVTIFSWHVVDVPSWMRIYLTLKRSTNGFCCNISQVLHNEWKCLLKFVAYFCNFSCFLNFQFCSNRFFLKKSLEIS